MNAVGSARSGRRSGASWTGTPGLPEEFGGAGASPEDPVTLVATYLEAAWAYLVADGTAEIPKRVISRDVLRAAGAA